MALPQATSSGGSLPSGRTFCISLAQVKKCTENFSRKRIIAEGGESIIYKGAATDGSGKTWAVKHLNPNLDARYFFREVEQIANLRHDNVLQLLCYCDEEDYRILIYEYMDKGSLGRLLWDQNRGIGDVLCFGERLAIAIGAAEGLAHLHTHLGLIHRPVFKDWWTAGLSIIHHGFSPDKSCESWVYVRDVKTDNILLDQNNVAKIADFGTLKEDFADNERTRRHCTGGYLSPECFENGRNNLPLRCTRESDVYSFGVVLISLLSSRPALLSCVDRLGKTRNKMLGSWVMEEVPDLVEVVRKRQDRIASDLDLVVDPRLWGLEDRNYPPWKLQKFAKIGMRCLRREISKRPKMTKVATMLKNLLPEEGGEEEEESGSESGALTHSLLKCALSVSSSISSNSCLEERVFSSGSARKYGSPNPVLSPENGEILRLVEECLGELEDGVGGRKGISREYGMGVVEGLRAQAKEGGDGEALLRLGAWYAGQIGCQPQACEVYGEAEGLGCESAGGMVKLVRWSEEGGWRKWDAMPQEEQLYRKAAEWGVSEGMVALSSMYIDEEREDKFGDAFEWARRAAGRGSAAGKVALGRCYEEGVGTGEDVALAMNLYREASAAGNVGANRRLALCYETGRRGVPRNMKNACIFNELAAKRGMFEALVSLAKCEERGEGRPLNVREAVEKFAEAMEGGDVEGMKQLGDCYWFGRGVVQNMGKAAGLYLRAAKMGNVDAQFNIGLCLKKGWGVNKSVTEAKEWFTRAARAGDVGAKAELKSLKSTLTMFVSSGGSSTIRD